MKTLKRKHEAFAISHRVTIYDGIKLAFIFETEKFDIIANSKMIMLEKKC